MIHFKTERCPHCGLPFELQILGFCSGLGPPIIQCFRCKKTIETTREEWPFHRKGQIGWYICVSLFYVFLGALIGGNSLFASQEYWAGNFKVENLPMEDEGFQIYGAASAIFIIAIQVWRVFSSIERKRERTRTPIVEGLYSANFNFGGHLKFLVLVLMPAFFAVLKYWVVS